MSDKLETKIAEATSHEDIQALLHAEPQESERTAKPAKSELVEPESVLCTRTETIGGREFTFEADSEGELTEMIVNAYRVATAVKEEPVQEPQQPTAEEAAKVAVDRAELEMQFRRGQLSAADYLERTGAINDYLASQGVPVEELRQTVEQQRNHAETQSWSDAVEQFLKSPAGSDWPGGDNNRELIGLKIAQLGLIESTDKCAAIAQAYASMKQTGMVFEPAGSSEANQTASTTQPDSVRQTATTQQAQRTQPTQHRTQTQQSSSVWGAGSGTSVNDMRDQSHAVPASKAIPADARPEEIMAAWKENLLANGQDPNSAFLETFRGGRR